MLRIFDENPNMYPPLDGTGALSDGLDLPEPGVDLEQILELGDEQVWEVSGLIYAFQTNPDYQDAAYDQLKVIFRRYLNWIVQKYYRWETVSKQELEGAALLGFNKALEGFDTTSGNSFTTYSYHAIHNAILDLISSQVYGESRRVFTEYLFPFYRARTELAQLNGSDNISAEEVFEFMGDTTEYFRERIIDLISRRTIYLDARVGDTDFDYGDLIPDSKARQSLEYASQKVDVSEIIQGFVDSKIITAREAQALWLAFGLDNTGQIGTYEDAGELMEISRTGVENLVSRARKKIILILQARRIIDEIDPSDHSEILDQLENYELLSASDLDILRLVEINGEQAVIDSGEYQSRRIGQSKKRYLNVLSQLENMDALLELIES